MTFKESSQFRISRRQLLLTAAPFAGLSAIAQSAGSRPLSPQYLDAVMDEAHGSTYVYRSTDDAANHFVALGKILPDAGDEASRQLLGAAVPEMDDAWLDKSSKRGVCIKCTFKARRADHWGGWGWFNGVLGDKDREPRVNFGETPDSGFDLRGATRLSFRAKGRHGGERVEFFCFGAGRDDLGRTQKRIARPDSAKKAFRRVTLPAEWKDFEIPLKGLDLSYCLCGFGWSVSSPANEFSDVGFFLEDIKFDKARLNEPRFLVSYKTIFPGNDFDVTSRNVAHVYDNSLALMAFLATGQRNRAGLVADALVYAQEHDRYFSDGRLRNVYQAGDLILPPGWRPLGKADTVRMAGWFDRTRPGAPVDGTAPGRHWLEDIYNVSTTTGNVAWAGLALLAYFETAGGERYLRAAGRIGEWILLNSADTRGVGGFTGGYQGWETGAVAIPGQNSCGVGCVSGQMRLQYKSVEHNLDCYALFKRLAALTRKPQYNQAAESARALVFAMWDDDEGRLFTGTDDAGVKPNDAVIPVDCQAWSCLAMRDDTARFRRALDYAAKHHTVGAGFGFEESGKARVGRDQIWWEGTAHMAAAYHAVGENRLWQSLVAALHTAQLSDGGLPAADGQLDTGFDLPSGDNKNLAERKVTAEKWFYFDRAHVGATAWAILAEQGVNPFWLGHQS